MIAVPLSDLVAVTGGRATGGAAELAAAGAAEPHVGAAGAPQQEAAR